MSAKHLLLFLLVFSTSFAILPQDSDWKIPYSKYRLIYSVDINSTVYASPLIEITIQIPHSYIDDMLQYYEAHNYTMNASMWPVRLYYFNQTSGEQTQIRCLKSLSGNGGSYPFCYWNHTYRGVPDQLNILTENSTIEIGTNYYIVYMPLFYWDDFEYAYEDYGWEFYNDPNTPNPNAGYISTGGYDPTTGYKLCLRSCDYDGKPHNTIKNISISIQTRSLLFLVDSDVSTHSFIEIYVEGLDNNIYTVRYYLRSHHLIRDVLKDLSSKYAVSPTFFKKITKIKIYNSEYYDFCVDNIMLVPPDVNNQ